MLLVWLYGVLFFSYLMVNIIIDRYLEVSGLILLLYL